MSPLDLPPLYAIVDPEQIKGRNPVTVLRQLLDGGTALVQLRAKNLDARDFYSLAQDVLRAARDRGCSLIVNDRVDIALACDADGVHIGQGDLPLGAARKLMRGKIIGVSTHDIDQACEAERGGADYIGFGPMFGTTTKDTGYDARGVDMLRAVRAAVKIPIVAIGGIREENVGQVWQAGADSAAIISDILAVDDVAAKVRRIITLARQ
jgi:thiamine-phosphate pyrophosphorylase